MMSPLSFAVVVSLAVLPLAACAGQQPQPPGPPWAEVVSPDTITLRWYTDEVSPAQAQQVADAHCAPTGRRAAVAGVDQHGMIEIATYRCR